MQTTAATTMATMIALTMKVMAEKIALAMTMTTVMAAAMTMMAALMM